MAKEVVGEATGLLDAAGAEVMQLELDHNAADEAEDEAVTVPIFLAKTTMEVSHLLLLHAKPSSDQSSPKMTTKITTTFVLFAPVRSNTAPWHPAPTSPVTSAPYV